MSGPRISNLARKNSKVGKNIMRILSHALASRLRNIMAVDVQATESGEKIVTIRFVDGNWK